MIRRKNRFNQIFFLILIIALVLRVLVAFFTDLRWISDDSETYLFMADSILAGEPVSYFPNGFPLFIALFKLILPGAYVNSALIVCNILFSTATVALGMMLVKNFFNSPSLALFVGIFIAFYPNQINYVRHIMTETPTTFFLIFSIYLLLRKKFVASAFSLFLATIFRTSFIPLIPILMIAMYLELNKTQNFRGLATFGISILASAAIFSTLIFSDIIKLSNNLGKNLLISIQSYSHDINFKLNEFTDYEKSHPFSTYFQFAFDNPGTYLKQRLSSLQELWGWPSAGTPPNNRGLFAQILISIRIPLLILSLYEIIQRKKDVVIWILFSPILVLTLVHLPLFSMPRFNVVVEPFLIILSVLALDNVFSNITTYNLFKKKMNTFVRAD